MLQSLLESPMEYLTQLVLRLPAVLIAICMHESAHGWVANRCGDPTARLMGRITLNPVKHFDPAGMLCLVFFGVGWAKPVPINPLHFPQLPQGRFESFAGGRDHEPDSRAGLSDSDLCGVLPAPSSRSAKCICIIIICPTARAHAMRSRC